jgi:hypothetical protein
MRGCVYGLWRRGNEGSREQRWGKKSKEEKVPGWARQGRAGQDRIRKGREGEVRGGEEEEDAGMEGWKRREEGKGAMGRKGREKKRRNEKGGGGDGGDGGGGRRKKERKKEKQQREGKGKWDDKRTKGTHKGNIKDSRQDTGEKKRAGDLLALTGRFSSKELIGHLLLYISQTRCFIFEHIFFLNY